MVVMDHLDRIVDWMCYEVRSLLEGFMMKKHDLTSC